MNEKDVSAPGDDVAEAGAQLRKQAAQAREWAKAAEGHPIADAYLATAERYEAEAGVLTALHVTRWESVPSAPTPGEGTGSREPRAVSAVPNMYVGRGGTKREFLGAVAHAQGVPTKVIRAAGYTVPRAVVTATAPMRSTRQPERSRERRSGQTRTSRGSPNDDPHHRPPEQLAAAAGQEHDSGDIFHLWRLLPLPASVRCWVFLHAPELVQRPAWRQLAARSDRWNREQLARASDPHGLQHVGDVLGAAMPPAERRSA